MSRHMAQLRSSVPLSCSGAGHHGLLAVSYLFLTRGPVMKRQKSWSHVWMLGVRHALRTMWSTTRKLNLPIECQMTTSSPPNKTIRRSKM